METCVPPPSAPLAPYEAPELPCEYPEGFRERHHTGGPCDDAHHKPCGGLESRRIDLQSLGEVLQMPPIPRISAPAIETLLGDLPCSGWLREEYARLASHDDDWRRASAPGLLARHWRDDAETRPRLARTERLNAAQLLSQRIDAWVRSLPIEALRAIDREAALACDEALEALDALLDAPIDTDPASRPPALSECAGMDRDDAESLAHVLPSPFYRDGHLKMALRALDEMAKPALCDGFFQNGRSFTQTNRAIANQGGSPTDPPWWTTPHVELPNLT